MTVENYLAEAGALAGLAAILTTIIALISMCLITYATGSVFSLFM